ncbi:MAG: N-acetylmuramoyl-L-alanine amidase, partial [Stenotrophomonas sp.]
MRPIRFLLPLFACLLLAACASTGIRSPLATWVASPNYNARGAVIIVLHHTDQHSVQQ